MFYEAEVNRSHITYKVSPSSWMDFLSVLQPFHLNIWIGSLNRQFYSVSLCHLVGRIQLSEERWVSEILNTIFSYVRVYLRLWKFYCLSVKSAQTSTFLFFFLHLLQSLEHTSQVSNAILKSNLLIFRSGSIPENLPHIHIRFCARLHRSNTHKPQTNELHRSCWWSLNYVHIMLRRLKCRILSFPSIPPLTSLWVLTTPVHKVPSATSRPQPITREALYCM